MGLLTRRRRVECVIALLVFVAAGLGGYAYLRDDRIKVRPDATPDDYSVLPALLWATGHGLSFTVDPLAHCAAFLRQEQDSLDPSAVPNDLACFPAIAKSVQDRENIYYLVGIVWRVFGISWHNVKVILAFIFALNAVLAYGIFRFGMNRLLSVVGTALTMASPIMLREAPWLRSVCKAPFILASILLICVVLTNRLRPRTLLPLALLMGVVVGVGFGFRQDLLICMPATLTALALGARVEGGHQLLHRALACMLATLGFGVCAWVPISMTRDTGGNNAFYLTQGFSANCIAAADLKTPFYAVLTDTDDYLVHAFMVDYASKQHRVGLDNFRSVAAMRLAHFATMLQCAPARAVPDLLTNSPPGDLELGAVKGEAIGRDLVRSLLTRFPGDVIARWYGAALRVVRGVSGMPQSREEVPVFETMQKAYQPVANHLTRYGLWYALAVLLIVSARSVWLALCIAGLVLWFGGYVSLEFQPRHAFHLSFLGFWFPLCLLGAIVRGLHALHRMSAGAALPAIRNVRGWLPYAGRMALFAVVTVAALASVLALARYVQASQTRALHEQYAHADLETWAYEVQTDTGHDVYVPQDLPAFRQTLGGRIGEMLAGYGLPAVVGPNVRSEYLAVDLECNGNNVFLAYEGLADGFHYEIPHPHGGSHVRVFVPVFKYSDSFREREPSSASFVFNGFRLGPDLTLKGMSRVRNADDFPMLLTVALTDDPNETRWEWELPDLCPWSLVNDRE